MSTLARRLSLPAGALLTVALLAAPASAQTYAAGVGGAFVDDTGNPGKDSSLSSAEWHVFAELQTEQATFFELRYTRMSLSGTVENSPELDVDAVESRVTYRFKEDWWEPGFFAGLGYYRTSPQDPSGDQVSVDQQEDAFGMVGGVSLAVRFGKSWEARLEGTGRYIATDVKHYPLSIGLSLAYRF